LEAPTLITRQELNELIYIHELKAKKPISYELKRYSRIFIELI